MKVYFYHPLSSGILSFNTGLVFTFDKVFMNFGIGILGFRFHIGYCYGGKKWQ